MNQKAYYVKAQHLSKKASPEAKLHFFSFISPKDFTEASED